MSSRYRTQTFNVEGHKIKVKVGLRTSVGNHAGFRAWVTDNKGANVFYPCFNVLTASEAIEKAYIRFVQSI